MVYLERSSSVRVSRVDIIVGEVQEKSIDN